MVDENKAWNYTINDDRFLEVSGRALPMPGIQDDPVRCFRVNLEWCILVAGAISELLNLKAWTDAQDESYTAIQQLLTMLEGEECTGMSCEEIIACIEASENQIAITSTQLSSMVDVTSDHLDGLEAAYDTTPQSIGANIPVGAPDSDDQDALCYALDKFVSLYASVKKAKIQQFNFLQVSLFEIKNFAAEMYNAIDNRIAFDLLPDWDTCYSTLEEAISVLSSEANIDDTVCCLVDGLDGAAMSLTLWNDALSACATGIGCQMNEDNNLRMYLSFLEAYNVALQRQIDGETLPGCACADTWCYEWDFTLGGMGAWQLVAGTQTANGIESMWVNNIAEKSGVCIDGGETFHWTNVEVEYQYSVAASRGANDRVNVSPCTTITGIDGNNNAVTTGQYQWVRFVPPATTDITTQEHNTAASGDRRWILVHAYDYGVEGHTVYIRRIKLWGTGIKPASFPASNCEA